MKAKTIYIAEDGTEFDSKEECQKYENAPHFYCLLDEGWVNETHVNDFMTPKAIYFPTEESAKLFMESPFPKCGGRVGIAYGSIVYLYIEELDMYTEVEFNLISQLYRFYFK